MSVDIKEINKYYSLNIFDIHIVEIFRWLKNYSIYFTSQYIFKNDTSHKEYYFFHKHFTFKTNLDSIFLNFMQHFWAAESVVTILQKLSCIIKASLKWRRRWALKSNPYNKDFNWPEILTAIIWYDALRRQIAHIIQLYRIQFLKIIWPWYLENITFIYFLKIFHLQALVIYGQLNFKEILLFIVFASVDMNSIWNLDSLHWTYTYKYNSILCDHLCYFFSNLIYHVLLQTASQSNRIWHKLQI